MSCYSWLVLYLHNVNKNGDNSKTSHHIDVKLGPVTKLDKGNTVTSKKINENVISTNCGVIFFFLFMANLQASGNWIPGAWSIKLTFSLTITSYFTQPEKRTKKSLIQFSFYCFH